MFTPRENYICLENLSEEENGAKNICTKDVHTMCTSLMQRGAKTCGGSVPETQTEEDNKCQEYYAHNDRVGEFGS